MDLTVAVYMQVGAVLAAAALIQGAAGFAFGLFATPMLLVIGLVPEQAIPMVAASALCQSGMGVWMLRHEVQWRLLAKVIPVALATLPVGVWLLSVMAEMDPGTVRQAFGAVVLGVLALQWMWRVEPKDDLHIGWGALAMVGAGVGTGAVGMAGPATALWVTAYNWPSERVRATMWAVFLVLTPPNLFFLYQKFGPVVGESVWRGGIFLPLVFLATMPGLWLGNRLGPTAVRRLATGLVLLVGGYSILQPMLWPGLS